MAYDIRSLRKMTGTKVFENAEEEPITPPQDDLVKSTGAIFDSNSVDEANVTKTPDVRPSKGFNIDEEIKKYQDFNPESDEKLKSLEQKAGASQLTKLDKLEPEFARFTGGLQRMVGALGSKGQEANQMAAANVSDAEKSYAEKQAMLKEALGAAQGRRTALQGEKEQILKGIGVQQGMSREQRAVAEEGRSAEKSGLELDAYKRRTKNETAKELRESDTKSAESSMYRQLATRMGIELPNGDQTTAKEIKDILGPGEALFKIEQTAKANEAALAQANERLALQQKALDIKPTLEDKEASKLRVTQSTLDMKQQDKNKEFVAKAEVASQKADNYVNDIKNLRAEAVKEGGVGPARGRLTGAKAMIGMSTGPATDELNIKLVKELNRYINEITGAAVGSKEMIRLASIMPNINEDEALFNAKLDAFKEAVRKGAEEKQAIAKVITPNQNTVVKTEPTGQKKSFSQWKSEQGGKP